MYTTSDAALRRNADHAKDYDGATKFTARYTIKYDAMGMLDTSASSVTFDVVNFTNKGTVEPPRPAFTTKPAKITDVTLTADCPPKVKSFKFSTDDWYPDAATGAGGLKNRTMSGTLDLSASTATWTAKYAIIADGAIYTYSITGKVAPPSPAVGDGGGSGSGGGGGDPFDAPAQPFEELADAGTTCDDSTNCDQPDGLSCIGGYCEP
jgi:hypothetical protein